MDLYYADHAQPLTTAGEELDDVDHVLSDLSDLSEVWKDTVFSYDPVKDVYLLYFRSVPPVR